MGAVFVPLDRADEQEEEKEEDEGDLAVLQPLDPGTVTGFGSFGPIAAAAAAAAAGRSAGPGWDGEMVLRVDVAGRVEGLVREIVEGARGIMAVR